MMLLKIDDNKGYYRVNDKENFKTLDFLSAGEMLEMFKFIFKVDQKENTFSEYIEEYKDEKIGNEAHKIIYEKLYNKLKELWNSKEDIINEINKEFDNVEKEYLK